MPRLELVRGLDPEARVRTFMALSGAREGDSILLEIGTSVWSAATIMEWLFPVAGLVADAKDYGLPVDVAEADIDRLRLFAMRHRPVLAKKLEDHFPGSTPEEIQSMVDTFINATRRETIVDILS